MRNQLARRERRRYDFRLTLPLGETPWSAVAMLSIGEFSRVTGLTIKTIRLYDEKGLLPPASVRDESGYRYYDAASVERARVIKQLRDLEFSLTEISQILEAGSDEADIVSYLERHEQVIAEKLEKYAQVHRALKTVIQTEREAAMATKQSFEVEEKTLPTMLVAGIRARGVYGDSGARFGELGRAVGRHIAGKALGLYYDTEYKEADADFESCFPVRKEVEAEGVVVHTIEGGRSVTLVHRGPYAELGRSYQRVFEYIREKKLSPKVPSREVYLKGPGMIFKGNPKKYLTEIQVLVEG
jgi:DNA-binding transcriptional MerR regulator